MEDDKRRGMPAAAVPLLLIMSIMTVSPAEAGVGQPVEVGPLPALPWCSDTGEGESACYEALQQSTKAQFLFSEVGDGWEGGERRGGVGGGEGGGGGGQEPPPAADGGPVECTAQAGSTCEVRCTLHQGDSSGTITVYADKEGVSGSITTTATGDCISGGSVSTTDHLADGMQTSNYAATTKTGTITCKVTSVNGATGSGRCFEPPATIAQANDGVFCMLNRDDPAEAEGHLACLLN